MQRIVAWSATILLTATLAADELPDLELAIPPSVKALGKPAIRGFPGGIWMAVTAGSDEAQAHVNQGINHLHGGWEFEASRHFAAAMREDPACLLAHWGMVMCLLDPAPESLTAREAAAERMLELIDLGGGTELERGYAYGLVKFMQQGPAAAANAFRKVADKFPNDLQAAVFAALFGRGGFDESGDATPDQQAAEKQLLALVEKHPQSPVPLHALLFIRAEGPKPAASLDLVRKLGELVPDYPPYLHLTGHYQWRSGEHRKAAATFARAASRYHDWKKEQEIPLADSPEWIKAECYRVVALASSGDFENALAAAKEVAAIAPFEDRPSSPGNRMLLWEAKTLPARLLLSRSANGDVAAATASLPKPDSLKKFHEHTLAYWWIDSLRIVLETERLLHEHEHDGDLKGAREALQALAYHGESFAKIRPAAAAGGEASFWNRSFRAMEMLACDLRGRAALAGGANLRGAAYNWFSSAAERQLPSTLLMPPGVLTPMASRLGAFCMDEKNYDQAIEAYQRALVAFPNDITSLTGLKNAYEKAGKSTEAEETTRRIESLKAD
jgi:tetratricopeptide (TPR) repeat protein